MTMVDTIHISKHPIVAQKLSQLREKNQSPKVVRELTSDLSFLLGYEASTDVTLKKGQMASSLYTDKKVYILTQRVYIGF